MSWSLNFSGDTGQQQSVNNLEHFVGKQETQTTTLRLGVTAAEGRLTSPVPRVARNVNITCPTPQNPWRHEMPVLEKAQKAGGDTQSEGTNNRQ